MRREYMIARREKLGLSREDMARMCNGRFPDHNGVVSPKLIEMLEDDAACVTHPNLAERVAKAYRLTTKQKTGLLPENYRPGPDYDPDKYRQDCGWGCDHAGGLAEQGRIRTGAAYMV